MKKELISMGLSIEDIYYDYKLVADSITDDESFQKADTGILLSNLYDVVEALEKQIPNDYMQEYSSDGFFKRNICPRCEDVRGLVTSYSYCPWCGQKLRWE